MRDQQRPNLIAHRWVVNFVPPLFSLDTNMAMLEVALGTMLIFASLSLVSLAVASKNTLYTYNVLALSALLLFTGIRLMLGMFT